MTQARFNVDSYTTRVLDVVKGKYGLKNREEALKKFVERHGEEYVEREPREEYLREIERKYEKHIKEKGLSKMSNEELDELLEQ